MNEYEKEIADLEAQRDQLVEADGDRETISDLNMQIEVLQALYRRARQLLAAGEGDPDLRAALRMRGYGDWNLDNVYAYVFEASVDIPDAGHAAFVSAIRDLDFAAGLQAS